MRPPSPHDDRDFLTVCDDRHPGKILEVRPQSSNIDACVSFSFVRCMVSLVSIGLVLTDIPRTGLSIDLLKYYPKVGPDTVMYYGPYAYPVVHFNRTQGSNSSASIQGFSGDTPVDAVDVWGYKFDSLSIPTRALADYLNVTSYPPCVLYKEHCAQPTLPPETAFTMVDDLLTAIKTRYFMDGLSQQFPFVFETTNYWADRLHHVILGTLGYRIDSRVHVVYHQERKAVAAGGTLGINICAQANGKESHHPMVCKSNVPWVCDHPFLGSQFQIPLSDSVSLRVAALQQLYPKAEIELTMITTRSELRSQQSMFFPTIFYWSDGTEITTFIRGRECSSDSNCTTLFVDDYRYERATLETSSEALQGFVSLLRAVSQCYVWLRVALLVFVCSRCRLSEPRHREKSILEKVRVLVHTLAKIPSHIIVYGSWLPIVGYSTAHFVDCGLVHVISDNFWSTANGFFSFDFVNFVVVASIQMRNIWLIALLWKIGISLFNRFGIHRSEHWRPQNGVVVFRGLFIGITSSLTTFSFLRALRFRDSRVLSFHEIQRTSGLKNAFMTQRLPKGAPDFGYPLDIKTTAAASTIVFALVHLIRLITRITRSVPTRTFLCHTYYVPLSTGVLFPITGLNPFWFTGLLPLQEPAVVPIESERRTLSIDHIRERVLSAVRPAGPKLQRRWCETCNFISTPIHWRAIQGCRRHETLFAIGRRSTETQSMVRLTHIAMFSDPIVFFQLRILGRQLLVYHVQNGNTEPTSTVDDAIRERRSLSSFTTVNNGPVSTAFLSPVLLVHEGNERGRFESYTVRDSLSTFELVTQVDSSEVPWGVLVDCG